MTQGEWPTELSARAMPNNAQQQAVFSIKSKTRREQRIDEIIALLQRIDIEGLAVIRERAKDAVRDYPLVKQTPSLSQ